MQPNSQFFRSLKRLEKRLKLDTNPEKQQQSAVEATPIESLSTPLLIHNSLPLPNTSNLHESETPNEFLSNSPDFDPTQVEEPPQEPKDRVGDNGVDDIDLLMKLLRLSDCDGVGSQNLGCDDDGFLGKIVGVKGVKSLKEFERLNKWIEYFLKQRSEPLRLAHLLLGKAAFLQSLDGDGLGGLEFPSTIDEFLQNDPPSNEV